MQAVSFESAVRFRRWLRAFHARRPELVVAFNSASCGRGGMTYAEALDEALCFGWIDGVRRGAGPGRYTIRFSPRRPRSIWSLVNVRHARRLIAEGRMRAPGLRAFESRKARRTGVYSFEQRPRELPGPLEGAFRADGAAWAHWTAQPPGYRRTATWWVVSAVRDETRAGRLSRLITSHAAGRRIGLLSPPGPGKAA
jgi:uncharacterized protein YdeI (YjbR/CyaY-like superfamily)